MKKSVLLLLFLTFNFSYGASTKSYEYSDRDNVMQVTDSRGIKVNYEYDDFNRLISKKYPNGRKIKYEYDCLGHRIKVIDNDKITSFEYNIYGTISKVTFPNSQSVQYHFDPFGRLLKLIYPDGKEVSYFYDASDRLIGVKDLFGTTKYEYDEKLNKIKKKILSNGTSTEFKYNSARKISNTIHRKKDGSLIEKYLYEYDPNGNRIKIEKITPKEKSATTFEYDKLNRIIKTSHLNGFFELYTYDKLGNRLSKTTPKDTINYEYDDENRITKAGDTRFYYDAAGNLIKKKSSDTTAEYTYDADNLLVSYIDNINKVFFEYDGEGNRISKTVNGMRTDYTNDLISPIPQVLLKTVQKSLFKNEKVIRYVYGGSRISQSHDDKTQFYLYDSLNRNVCSLIDNSEHVLNNYEYDSFGNRLSKNEGIKNVYKYASEQLDEETGLVYLRNRYYDPEIGRFISKDKNLGNLAKSQSLNPYVYVENNPINFIDPLGLEAISPEEMEFVILHINSRNKWFGGQGSAGHVFMEFPERNTFRGNYPERMVKLEAINIKPTTFSIGCNCESNKVTSAIKFMDNINWTITKNCVYTAVEGMKEMGFKHADKIHHGLIPSPQGLKQQMLEFYYKDSEGLILIDNKISKSISPLSIDSSPSLDYGGISLSKRAEIQLNLLDIKGAAFDYKTGQLIIFGKKEHYLPKLDMDDLAVAIKSIYGLGIPSPQDPGISIDPSSKKNQMKVRYDGATVNTSFGYIMFEADRLLKCLSLGMDNITKKPFKADVSGYLSLHDRLGGKWKGTINNRMWFIPEKITLIEDESHKGFIFDEVKMQVLTESQKNNLKIDMPQCLAFAKHLNDNYDEYAEHFPVLEKLKKLGKITAIIKWLKDNNILFDTAFFENYSPKYFETPKFTPAIVRNSLGGRSQLFTIGGVIYQLNQNNFTVYNDFLVDNIISTAISSRPSDNDFSWTFNSPVNRENFNAVAQSIYKTKKPGNVKKQFLDMSFSHNKSKIQLFRFYNSFSEDTSFFGYGWRVLPYELKFSLEKMKIEKKDGNDTEICRGIFVKLLDKEDFFEINGLDDGGFPIFKNKSNTYLLKDLLNGSFSLHKQNGEIIAIFDNFGKLIKMLDEDNWTTFEYIQKKLIKICHEKDINITFEYQNDKIVKALGSNGASIIYKYNNLGLLEQISNEIGLDFYYFYDKDKRLNKILDNERNMIFSAVYDDYNRAKETIEGEVRYENEFSLDKKMVKIINPIGEETIFYFDGNDRLVQRKEKNKIMYFSYEQENIFLPTKIMDEMGYATVCRYDNNGNILYLKNIFGAEWEFYYNKNGNLTLERSPMGRWKYYGYDESNRLIRTDLKVDEVIFSSDKSSFSIKSDGRYCLFYNYENQENIVKNITTLGGARASFVYNEFGKLEQVKAPTGYIKKRTFDKKNRLIQISDDFGIEVSYEYNSLNQVEKKITKMGNEQFQYNDFGDLIKVTDAKGNITIREYDSNHNLIKVVDSDMGVFRYEYTADDKIYRLNYPNGTSKIFEYNSKGLLEFEKDGTN